MAEKTKTQEKSNIPASGPSAPHSPAKPQSGHAKTHLAHKPDPAVAAEIETISHGPAALAVAHAPHGSGEDSDYA
ncbi:MAG: hypothetical protein Q7U24_04850, partial [Sulfurimicrobium sp.]|nr:hypothetical protein [Sulfurimicrobium sp.]